MRLTNEQWTVFRSAFCRAVGREIPLPDLLDWTKVTEVEHHEPGNMRDGIRARFIFAPDASGNPILELYFITDDYSAHKFIDHRGNISEGVNFQGQWGRPYYPDDEERTRLEGEAIQRHNDALHAELVAKGLERNFEDPAFEADRVTRIRFPAF